MHTVIVSFQMRWPGEISRSKIGYSKRNGVIRAGFPASGQNIPYSGDVCPNLLGECTAEISRVRFTWIIEAERFV
jgi:hypothetical protein